MKHIKVVVLCMVVMLMLSACSAAVEATPTPTATSTPTPTATPTPTPSPTPIPEVVVNDVPLAEIIGKVRDIVPESFDGYTAESTVVGYDCEIKIYGNEVFAEACEIISMGNTSEENIEKLKEAVAEVYSICDTVYDETISLLYRMDFEDVNLRISLYATHDSNTPVCVVENGVNIVKELID